MEVLYRLSYRGIFRLCGGGRIRTSVGEAGRFTVCSLWPLGHTPGHAPAALCAERPNMVANATDFSTDREGTAGTFDREPGKGFEPPTGRLQGGCSTSELPGRAARWLRQLDSTLRTFGPRSQQESYETSSPGRGARSNDCNSASPTPTSSFAECGARQGGACYVPLRRISSSLRRVSNERRSAIRDLRRTSGLRVMAGSSSRRFANSRGVARVEPRARAVRCRAKSAV